MATRTRRTIDDRIAEAKAELKKLRDTKKKLAAKEKLKAKTEPAKAKPVVIKKDSPGITGLLTMMDTVAIQNNIKVPELIKAVARLKHTGLFITKKTKMPNGLKSNRKLDLHV